MKRNNILILIIFFTCCSSPAIKVKNVYDNQGNLFEKYNYQNLKDTANYKLTRYYKNGNVEFILPFKESKIEGIGKVYYPNGDIQFIKTFRNSQLNGITYLYNERSGKLFQEILFIDDIALVVAEHGQAILEKDTLFGVTYSYLVYGKDTTLQPVGSITNETNCKKNQLMNSYFIVNAKDTITLGSKYEINIEFLIGTFKNLTVILKMGYLNKEGNFTDDSKTKTYVGENNKLSFCVDRYHLGTNLLLGKIKLIQEGKDITSEILGHPQIKDYIFYRQFEVIE